MARSVCVLMVFLTTALAQAADCLDFAARYKVKVADNLVLVKVEQRGCERFELTYAYSDQRVERKAHLPDGVARPVSDDGDLKVTERSELRKIVVGGKRKTVALWVQSDLFSRVLEKKFRVESYFYAEDTAVGRALVERRETFDESGERLRTVYLGMVEDK